MPDSVLTHKIVYNKKGNEIGYEAYDSAGRKEWSSRFYYHYDDSGRLLYRVCRLYRHDDFVNYKKTLHRNDTTIYKLTDRHYDNNGDFERKTGRVLYNSKGELTELEILNRGLHITDTNFYTRLRLYYTDSKLYCRDSYYDPMRSPMWSTYFTWDSIGNLRRTVTYESGKMEKPKIESIYYYNTTGQLYRVESETFTGTYYVNPYEDFKEKEHIPVHYSHYYEYDKKRLLVKRMVYTNGILSEVVKYRYKFF